MAKKKATGRFYLFLALLGVAAFFLLRQFLPLGTTEAVVMMATTSYTTTVDSIIVRDETVVSYEGNGRVVYVAAEGALVNSGDEVAEIYSAGYSEKEMAKLETVRQNIRTYHQTILDNIIDKELERLEENVQAKAQELKELVNNQSGGNFLNIENQLQQAMLARQEYLSSQRADQKLNSLYEEETKRLNSIASWKQSETAQKSGIVSFYLDGCERFLTPDNLEKITVADVRSILAGNIPEVEESQRTRQNVYRLVTPGKWYVLLLSSDARWGPVNGHSFSFQIDGYDDIIYNGTVTRVQKSGDEVMAVLQVDADIGPMMNHRYGKAHVGVDLTGLSVPAAAISTQNELTGVWLNDVPGGTFIPVNVLSIDSQYALIEPIVEGSIVVGSRVLVPR